MNPQRLITIAIAFALVAVSCTTGVSRADKATRESMRTLKPLLLRSEKVDSCLAVLQAMDTTAWTRPADKAEYALLHAMALDKNDIDATDLTVLEPAVDYYTKWYYPNKADKFYTWYYRARIEENAKNYNASLRSYLKAERFKEATNDVYRTRLYFGFERIYVRTITRKEALQASQRALYYARKSGDTFNYGVALTDCICNASVYSQLENAEEYMNEYERDKEVLFNKTKSQYLRSKVVFFRASHKRDSLQYYLNEYVSGTVEDPILCALAYLFLGDAAKADYYLNIYERTVSPDNTLPYNFYMYKSAVKESMGDYKDALVQLQISNSMLGEMYLYSLDSEVAAVAERYHNTLKQRTSLLAGVLLVIVFLLLIMSFFIEKRRKERLLKNQIEDIRIGYDRLSRLISGKISTGQIDDNIDSVAEAVERIGDVLLKGKSLPIKNSFATVVSASGTKRAITLVALFAAVHCSNTFAFLQGHDLNDFETGYCFLLLMGFTTNQLITLLKRGNLKNVNVVIRRKLNINNQDLHLVDYLKGVYESHVAIK